MPKPTASAISSYSPDTRGIIVQYVSPALPDDGFRRGAHSATHMFRVKPQVKFYVIQAGLEWTE
jgi:hypothetical protein